MQHRSFLIAGFSLLLLLTQQIALLFGKDMTMFSEQITGIFNTILSILVLVGVVVDPTTAGTTDSRQALGYRRPRSDRENK